MGSRWASVAGVWLAGLVVSPGTAVAQAVPELGVIAMATASDPAIVAAGAYGGLRTSLRTRVSAALLAGVSDGEAAWRGELLAHFLLNPTRLRGVGVYGAGGIALVGGPVDRSYIVLTLGVEARPAASSGWFVEAGVGGGARLAAGYRWRRFPARWRGF
ncbi:MAG TPA: hypothetical protein VFG66_16000 [Gemmatimonadales bacterium]|nr:hypothetical protein [Gemmatimonadales bacterium]